MNGGRKVTPINTDGSSNGWAFTGEAKGGERVTLVDDTGAPVTIGGESGDLTNYYTKQEVDSKLSLKADVSYVDSENNAQDLVINSKSDIFDVYQTEATGPGLAVPTILTQVQLSASVLGMCNNVDFSVDTLLDEITIIKSGVFELNGSITATHTNATNTTLTLNLNKNGLLLSGFVSTLGANNNTDLNFSRTKLLQLNAGDKLSLFSMASQGNTTNTRTSFVFKRIK